jgi:hypothetical protein
VVLFSQQWPLSNGLSHTAAWIAINRKWECNGNNIKMGALEVPGFLETSNFAFLAILGPISQRNLLILLLCIQKVILRTGDET